MLSLVVITKIIQLVENFFGGVFVVYLMFDEISND